MDWYHKTGMLGMGVFGSAVATLIAAWLIAFIIGCIRKKGWVGTKEYWFTNFHVIALIFKAWAGMYTRFKIEDRRVEVRWFNISIEDIDASEKYANKKMIEAGWTYPRGYVDDWSDCTEFAEVKVFYMKEWFFKNKQPRKGHALPIFTTAYTDDKRGGHVIVECLTEKGFVYYDVYPNYETKKVMSKAEIASRQWSNI